MESEENAEALTNRLLTLSSSTQRKMTCVRQETREQKDQREEKTQRDRNSRENEMAKFRNNVREIKDTEKWIEKRLAIEIRRRTDAHSIR